MSDLFDDELISWDPDEVVVNDYSICVIQRGRHIKTGEEVKHVSCTDFDMTEEPK